MVTDQIERPEVDPETARKIKDFVNLARGDHNAVDEIVQVPDYIIEKASLISAHLLLPSDAKIIDMGCGDGRVTYAMALLNPLRQFVGVDHDRNSIKQAEANYTLPNLTFQFGDARIPDVEDESVDGIINSNILHEIHSSYNRDPEILTDVLEAQSKKLKPGGIMLVRDYMKPPADEYVLLELADVQSVGNRIEDLSYADLLIEYSQTARPMEEGYEGFYLEELDPSILKTLNPNLVKKDVYEPVDEEERERIRAKNPLLLQETPTRVFRLLHKWAVEFIHRKEERDTWKEHLDREMAFFSYNDFRREFAKLGMRMLFSAPYRNPWVVDHFYKGRFHLYNEDARLLPPPATNYFIVAQKIPDKQSLILDERRPSQAESSELELMTVRDEKSGVLHEIVRRPGEFCDIIPYRFTEDGRLMIYVRTGYPRPIINAVKRGNANIDDKKWSGHLIEPMTMDTFDMTDDIDENKRQIIEFVKRHASLNIRNDDSFYVGLTYFPAPDKIDEAIEPVFVEVKKPPKTAWPIAQDEYTTGFKFGGTIMELDANDVLRAAQVGLLPEPRLEIHVFDIMVRYGIDPPPWVTGKLTVENFRRYDECDENTLPPGCEIAKMMDAEQILDEWQESGFREDVMEGNKHLKVMRSVFVEEGKSGGAMRGIASQDYEFLVTEDGVENIAVVFPVTRGWDDNLMMGVQVQNLPVPQRLGGSGATLTAPSFVIPRSVRTMHDAKVFVGEQFGIGPDRVWKLGESYFSHTSMTPQRVYPFIVAAEGKASGGPDWQYHSAKKLWLLLYTFKCFSADLVKGVARVHMALGEEHGMSPERSMEASRHKQFDLNTDKTQVQIPGQPHAPLSRVMGQRGSVSGSRVDNQKTMNAPDTQTPEKKVVPVSLDKKPTQKLVFDFNPDQNNGQNDSKPEAGSLKKSYEKANVDVDMKESAATQTLDAATQEVSEQIKSVKTPDPILRAIRPEPNSPN